MDYSEREHLKKLVLINGNPVADELFSVVLNRRENGIDDCTLIANNDNGKAYIGTLHIGDTVALKYSYSEVPIWDNIKAVFSGKIQELTPTLTKVGETCTATAYAHPAYGLKQMRVKRDYGVLAYNGKLPVNSFVSPRDKGHWETSGSEPWLRDDDDTNYIYILVNTGHAGSFINGFNFDGLSELYAGMSVSKCYLWIKAKLYDGSEGHYPSVDIRPYYSLDNGISWNPLDALTYNSTNYVEQYINITSIVTDWSKLNAIHIKLQLSGFEGESSDNKGGIRVTYMYLEVVSATVGFSVRKILADSVIGVIPRFVNRIFNTGASGSSGYLIGTDYIYGVNDNNKINYIKFPYEDAFMGLQELIRISSAIRYTAYPTNWRGLHWIVDIDGNLLLAPIGNHNVAGVDSNHIVESKWSSRCPQEPIIVREDMVTQTFKSEMPLANYVLVAGRFLYPSNELWTETHLAWNYLFHRLVGVGEPHFVFTTDNEVFTTGTASLKCDAHTHNGGGPETYAIIYHSLNIDFTKVIGIESKLDIFFQMLRSDVPFAIKEADILELRLYSSEIPETPYNGGDYYYHNLKPYTATLGKWGKIQATVDWNDMQNVDVNGIWSEQGSPEWDDIKYIAILFYAANGGRWTFLYNIDNMFLVGNCIRGAKDSTSIGDSKIGCRMLTIKDSLAYTDTLNPDDSSTPLAQVALYELLRNRLIRTTGQISIPFNPNILAGQLVHIQANYNPSFNDYDPLDPSHQYGVSHYVTNRDFRIVLIQHTIGKLGWYTYLTLTDDIWNSIPLDTTDPYTIVLRAVNPDFQSKTIGSLKITGGDFDISLTPIVKDYPS